VIINAKESPTTTKFTGEQTKAFCFVISLQNAHLFDYSLMTNSVSSASGTTNRPRLCRSDHQPNMLEYIDTTLNDSFSSRLKLPITAEATTTTTSVPNGYDQFGNTIVDQYLLYILCQKLNPNRTDNRTENLYQSLHELLISNGKISKSFFEYSPPPLNRSTYQSIFNNYTNFIWNEFDVDILLELG
jgi:hypothetical protein